jgi:tripartite-type tricarboxylate transporter receptor subunit TctC
MKRRAFLHLGAGTVMLPVLPRLAGAQTYPGRSVRIIVGFPPGGGNDLSSRLIGQALSERLGQPFIIENRPGAGGNIGTEQVIHSAPDGYTLLGAGTPNAVNATLYENLSYNFIRDTTPIAAVMRFPNVLSVNPSFPARTVPELIAYAKANPGKVNFGSGGSGTTSHLAGELFKMLAGVNLIHVPYRGEALALADVIGGHLDIAFATMPSSLEQIKAGRLRALAVTASARSDALPDIPILSEFLPGYESSFWGGLVAPKSTRPEVVDRLSEEINRALGEATIKARIAGLGGSAMGGSAAEFGALIADETEKWSKVVRFAGIKAE